jgi:predicted RNA-binding Zn ribbon-like protein
VVFADDTETALLSAAALVRSAGPPDSLTTVADLDAFFREFGYTGRHERTRAELQAVRALRPALRALLTAEEDDVVAQVNALLARHRATPRVVRHDDLGWHVHAVSDDAPLPTRIGVETAMAMVDVVRAGELSRLSVCADEDCDGVVLDLSRNRSKMFCSTACSNRAAVAAYRRRQA